MHKLCWLLAATAAMAYSGGFAAETIQELNLTSDQTVDVAEGDTQTVMRVSTDGGSWTLKKTGLGTLVINDCEDEKAKLDVAAGRLEVRSRKRPDVLTNAHFHVDASVPSSLTFSETDGVQYVSEWHDVRSESPRMASTDAAKKPFVNAGYLNGRAVIDFGTVWHSRNQSGYGATLGWSVGCSHPEEIFAVIGDNEEAKQFVTGNGGAEQRNNTFFGNQSTQVAMRGNGSAGVASQLANKSSPFYSKATMNYTVDGTSVGNGTSYTVPDGMHLIDAYATKADYLGTDKADCEVKDFANERKYCKGGIRIAEYITFTTVLTAEERAAVQDYLQSRWFRPFKVDEIKVEDGAELAMPDAGLITANVYHRQGSFSGTGKVVAQTVYGKTTTVDAVTLSADATYDVPQGDTLVLKVIGGYDYLVTKTGKGKLVIETAESDKVRVDLREGVLELNANGQTAAESALAKAWFHVDATVAASMTTEEENGKTLVSAWADVRGAGHPSATAKAGGSHSNHKPYVTENGCAGLPVMDFGSLYNRATDGDLIMRGLDGYGAAMVWSETCTNPTEVFAVIGDTEDAKETLPPEVLSKPWGAGGRPNSFFGYTEAVTGYRGDNPQMALLHAESTLNKNGVTCTVDGETVTPTKYAVPDGMHVIDLKVTYATKSSPLNAFARERTHAFGGVRIGEYIVFTEVLTVEEREAVYSYLMKKWRPVKLAKLTAAEGTEIRVPDGLQAHVGIFEDKGATVTGTIVSDATFGEDIVVAEDVTDDPLPEVPAWFHVDAMSDRVSLSAGRQYEDKEIYCWSDVRGRKSKNGADYPGDGGIYAWCDLSMAKPFFNETYLGAGMPVVDFGPIWRAGTENPKRCLIWKQGSTSAEEVVCEHPYHFFVMVADHEDAKRGDGTNMSERDQAFIGNRCSQTPYPTGAGNEAYPVLARGNRPSSGTPATYYLSHSGFNSSYGTGAMRLDGEAVSTPGSSSFPEGFHLVSIDMHPKSVEGGRCRCDAFAAERNNLYGGQRLGEVIVVDRKLTSEETARIDALLLAKWKDGAGVERAADTVSVAAGKKLTLKYQRLTATNELVLDGTIVAKSVTAPATISVAAPGAAVEGALSLPATGTLALGDGWLKARGKQKVIDATSVAVIGGETAQWTATLPEGSRCREAKVTVEADGVYADFVPNGMMLIVR